MNPSLPIPVNQVIVLRALQMKPHIYEGTALPKSRKRRDKRIKRYRRDEARLDRRAIAEAEAS